MTKITREDALENHRLKGRPVYWLLIHLPGFVR